MMSDERVPTELGPIDAYLIEARSIGGISDRPSSFGKASCFP